jgi:methylthioribose-1-phosphate isomerase
MSEKIREVIYLNRTVSFYDERTIKWDESRSKVILIDQSKLPESLEFLECTKVNELVNAIKELKIRGAPAIGVAGAMGVALAAKSSGASTKGHLLKSISSEVDALKSARPTAVNLAWGVDKVLHFIQSDDEESFSRLKDRITEFTQHLADADVETNKRLSKIGAKLFRDGESVLTHCNWAAEVSCLWAQQIAGALATVGYGTALGVLRSAASQGKRIKVYATESRPVMQGARLTAYELLSDGFDVTLIPDSAVGLSIQRGLIDRAIVGADRITKTGNVFNKIGTFQIATLANAHNVPFYVAAPLSTFDFITPWKSVKIEERSPVEVREIKGVRTAPENVSVFNPAFDMTPPELIDAIICERAILRKPFSPKINRLKKIAVSEDGPVA